MASLLREDSIKSLGLHGNRKDSPKKTKPALFKIGRSFNQSEHDKTESPQESYGGQDFSNLTQQSQKLILQAVDAMKRKDSENVMNTLSESRELLRSTFTEFKNEQNELRKQIEDILKRKGMSIERSRENAIPISVLMRQKHDPNSLSDFYENSSVNATYKEYFEKLISSNESQLQHPSDKAAVVKYLRRRERRRRAEENRKANQLSDDILEKQTKELIQKMEGVDVKLENERQRQSDILRIRMMEKKAQTNNLTQANEIIDQAHEADLIRQRLEQTQRDKLEARLTNVRSQQSRSASKVINVQSLSKEKTDEQIELKSKLFQSINDDTKNTTTHTIQPIYTDEIGNGNMAPIKI